MTEGHPDTKIGPGHLGPIKTIIGFVPADDLPGVLPVAEHDGLVHDHPLGRLCLVTPGDPYDVEVRAGGKTKVRFDCIWL